MSWFGEIRTGLEVVRARVTGLRVPLFVQLMPTERCNLRCRYCYAQFGDRARPDFPLEPLLRLIDGLSELGARNIMLAGGEPLLYREIGQVVDRIVEHGIRCSVNTNGINVPARLDEISRADMLSISLDGPPELHNHYRGRGTYEKAVAAVESARHRGMRVQFQFTLTRGLKEAFEHVDRLARELGCFIGINFLRPQERIDGTAIEAAEAEDGEVREFLEWLIRTKPPTLPYPRHLLEYVLRWPYGFGRHLIGKREELKGFKPIPCRAGKLMIAIDNSGDIYPCTKLFYRQPLGHCIDGDIITAWKGLKPLDCEACLDLGCNLINDLLRLNPASLLGLLSIWLPGR